jgi:hypothetical protein
MRSLERRVEAGGSIASTASPTKSKKGRIIEPRQSNKRMNQTRNYGRSNPQSSLLAGYPHRFESKPRSES